MQKIPKCHQHEDQLAEYMCLDPSCSDNKYLCFKCVCKFHKNCGDQFIREYRNLDKKIFVQKEQVVSTIRDRLDDILDQQC